MAAKRRATTKIEPVMGPALLRSYVALLKVYDRDGAVSIRSMAIERGCAPSLVHLHLGFLRDLGLIEYVDHTHRSARPRYRLEVLL